VTVEVGVKPYPNTIDPSFYRIEARIDPSRQVVYASAERVDPRAEVEQRPE
jgi:hypothetical protein